tara:strand:+ start:2710 stop:3300 length:591 start_codon:yes stop_codon:yes gene_type:complete
MLILNLLLSYLIGSIPSGFIVGKLLKGVDLRELGSGSTGATNVLRQIGKKAALFVFLFDVFKGAIVVIISRKLQLPEFVQVACGLSAVTGHIWPLWLKGKGGKAVATGLGMFLALSLPVGLSAFGVFLTVLVLSKYVSLSSIFASTSLPIIMFFDVNKNYFHPYFLVSLITALFIIWRHRTNINRLLKGEEPKIKN